MASELFKKIEDSIKEAMKSHDNVKRDCLRSIVSEIKNQTVNAGKEMTDDICTKVLQKSVKTHNDSIEQFSSAGRDDLASKERAEVAAISEFLPKMLDASAIEAVVKEAVAAVEKQIGRALTKKDMGLVMKAVSSRGRAASIDMKAASKTASSLLAP